MIGVSKITVISTNAGTIGRLNECAPAMLTTSQGADDHQGRMSAMASIAVPHRNFGGEEKSKLSKAVEGCRSTERPDLKPHRINDKSKNPANNRCCRNVEGLSALNGKTPSTFRPGLLGADKPP